ncbi:Hypothetical protein, putative [Bodo saltans]|uniref:Uncharacterized protein n=1 Tax=Bodo saltans TaxID=75058 RepID=A0A0S4J166_BODSA|nr:Hypothetical protein, putative [Bodo saltans]|eukprot:CUG07455.1 Hypothetical protein, putative [Bodo saltans]
MDPEAKQLFRRKERDAKKDRERTLSYFQAAKTALDDAVRESLDTSMVSGIVDGLFSELLKKLRDDPHLYLLRNGTVCRAIEAAVLHNVNLLHTKTTLYQLLGKMDELAQSPTASFVLEALLNNLSMLLALDESSTVDPSMFEKVESEVDPDGAGSHPGSGLPNAFVLLERVEGEVKDQLDVLLMHNAGSRVVRALALVLAGLPPTLKSEEKVPLTSTAQRPVFEDLLTHFTQAILDSVERVFMPESEVQAPRRADAWVAAASCTSASLVIQTLLRCGAVSDVNALLRKKFESLTLRSGDVKTPLLAHLMRDALGSHVFQAYLKMPPTPTEQATLARASEEATSAAEAFVRELEKKTPKSSDASAASVEPWWTTVRRDHDELLRTPWDVALNYVMSVLDSELLCDGSEEVRQASFVLQDLATYSPSLLHLGLFYGEVLAPRLQLFVDLPALTAVLLRFSRKCAYDGGLQVKRTAALAAADPRSAASSSSSAGLASDVVERDIRAGAKYFSCPVEFRKSVSSTLVNIFKPLHAKGVWQALLVDQLLGEHVGFEIVENLLLFGPVASSMLLNALDKLNVEDLKTVATHAQGSFCLQQWIKTAALQQPSNNKSKDSKENKGPQDLLAVRRLGRRVQPLAEALAGDKYGCHVLECLFDASPIDLKETLVQQLIPLFHKHKEAQKAPALRKRERDEDGTAEEEEFVLPEGSTLFYQSKVFTKLCVEQYLHRVEEWRNHVAKVQHVQRLMSRILSATNA